MHSFADLKTRTKLTVGFGLLLVMLLVIAIAAWISLGAVHNAERINADVASIRNNLNGQLVALLGTLHVPAGPEVDSRLQDVVERSNENDILYTQATQLSSGDAELKSYMDRLTAVRAEYARVRDTEIIPLIREGKKEEAAAALLGSEAEQSNRFRDIAREFATHLTARSETRLREARLIFAVLGGCAVLMAISMIFRFGASIADPLEKVTAAAAKISEGDLDFDFADINRTDEVGVLMHTFHRMRRSLTVLAGRARQIADGDLTLQIKPRSERDVLGNAFASMVTDLRRMMQELQDAVNIVATSASEIMTSTTQLAATAAETAAAVTETTATVDEVKQTSQVSSEKAKYVAGESQKAADVARRGKTAVEQTIEGMAGIRQQMSTVAESILNLSAQGQAIGEIIATVDDLAAQSKLLALNASIEAVKAGDEGKGFAIVAQEVRSLAEQSKQATTQVRGILNDIKKATSSAVLATEQGGKTVEAGVRQSVSSGESIRALAESIAGAAQASTQIAATSQQQLVGMDQVALAMENIKSASMQILASTKQAEGAARQIHELGQKLKEIVERFKV